MFRDTILRGTSKETHDNLTGNILCSEAKENRGKVREGPKMPHYLAVIWTNTSLWSAGGQVDITAPHSSARVRSKDEAG